MKGSGMVLKPRYLAAGECTIAVEFGATDLMQNPTVLLALNSAVQQANIEGVVRKPCQPTARS